jgi:hypothetical protein
MVPGEAGDGDDSEFDRNIWIVHGKPVALCYLHDNQCDTFRGIVDRISHRIFDRTSDEGYDEVSDERNGELDDEINTHQAG